MRGSPEAIKALTQSLARPVSLGLLPAAHAYAAIVAAVARATTAGDDLEGAVAIWWFILGEHIQRERARATAARGGIWRTVRRLIQDRAPVNRILAEAHDVNGGQGGPLSESEVSRLVDAIILWCARKAQETAHA